MLNLFTPGTRTDPAGVAERKILLLPVQASHEVRRKGRSDMPDALTVNREHKDTVFRMLYKEKKELLTLYNALNGTDYQDPEELTVTTLENAIYFGMKNDVSFLPDSRLMLYEHQSTWNPNIPLRNLFYIARLLEKYVNECGHSLYSSVLIRLPEPRFVVFYNGLRNAEDDMTLKLSDSFKREEEDPALELKVRFLNINPGSNPELMEKCRTLREYSEFVTRVRKCVKEEASLADAVERAVTECIREGILENFLRSQRSEVVAMSILEFNREEELKKLRRSEYENGKAEGKAEALFLVLEFRWTVPGWLKERILKEGDALRLENWMRNAMDAGTLEDFLRKTGLQEGGKGKPEKQEKMIMR